MTVARSLLVLPLIAAVALSAGCKPRGQSLADRERGSEDTRQASEIQRLQTENDALRGQITQARDEIGKLRGSGGTLGGEVGIAAPGGLGDGFENLGDGRIALDEDFAFTKGSADLKGEGIKALEKLALKLNDGDSATAKVIVEGHTDETPVSRHATLEKYGDNWGLSAARSAAVVRALQKAGVAPERLRGAYRGQFAPRVKGGGKDEQGKNRRVEIYLAK